MEQTKGIDFSSIVTAILGVLAAAGTGFGIKALRHNLDGWGAAALALAAAILIAICAALLTRLFSSDNN